MALACELLLEHFGFLDRSAHERQCGPVLCCLFHLSYSISFFVIGYFVAALPGGTTAEAAGSESGFGDSIDQANNRQGNAELNQEARLKRDVL